MNTGDPCPTCGVPVDIYRAATTNAECIASHFDPRTRDVCPASHHRPSTLSTTLTTTPDPGTGVSVSTASPSTGLTISEHPALSRWKIHPACDVLPPINQADFALLVESVRKNGLLIPITLYEGEILDGRHRLVACHISGQRPDYIELAAGSIDPYEWVLAVNLERRHLTFSQKVMAAARLADVREAARKRHELTGGRAPRDAGPALIEAAEVAVDLTPRKSSEDAAERLGVSARSVERARVIVDRGTPELVAAVEAGAVPIARGEEIARADASEQRTVNLSDEKAVAKAAREFKVKRQAQAKVKEEARLDALREAAAVQQEFASSPIEIRLGKCSDIIPTLDRRRFPLIMADPPWTYKNGMGNGVARDHYDTTQITMEEIVLDLDAAYRVAAEHAYLMVWVTAPMADGFAIARFLAENADRWSWRYVTKLYWFKGELPPEGPPKKKGSGFHLRGDVEELLFFVKGKPKPIDKNFSSAWSSMRGEHSEKSPELMTAILEAFTVKGAPVLDMYAGLAPLARAAQATERTYLGIELDPERRDMALRRLPST